MDKTYILTYVLSMVKINEFKSSKKLTIQINANIYLYFYENKYLRNPKQIKQ